MDETSPAGLSAAVPTASVNSTVAKDDKRSAIDAADSEQGTNARVCSTPAAAARKQRAGRRGLTTRKRLGLALKIDASEADGQKDSEAREGQPTSAGTPGSGDSSGADADAKAVSDAVPWWILEYKCPPPGHLGAHDVPVAVKDEMKQLAVHELSSLVSEEKQSEVIITQRDGAGDKMSQTLALTTEQPTGARGIRQRRQHIESTGYSPSQKRKMDSSAPSPTVVAKEPKRFHERSNETPSDASCTLTAVTPSNLVRPLNKIDIHAANVPATAVAPQVAASETAKVSASASHASSSA